MRRNGNIHDESLEPWGLELSKNGELVIGGCNALELGNIYGTPLHVVHEARLRATAGSFLETMKAKYPGKLSVHYAFKCNPVPGIIKIIKESGLKAEVMSEYELRLALRLGYCGNEIIVNGPYKTDNLIRSCIENNVRLINVDSLFELEKINMITSESGKSTDVLLRINPDFIPSGMNKGSLAGSRNGSPFGIDMKNGEVMKALERIRSMEYVRFRGFHFHIGSGIRDTDEFRKAVSALEKILNDTEKAGFNIDILDIGGGLGVATSREMTTIELLLYQAFDILRSGSSPNHNVSFFSLGDSVTEGVLYMFNKLKIPEIIIEPGRCITGPNQLLLIKIHQVKKRNGLKKWLVADAGIGTLTMPTYYEHHEILLCNDLKRKISEKVTITGPGCFSADVIYKNKFMPEVNPGEMLAILDSGAYFTSWESSFGFPRPAIISVMNHRHSLLRTRESFEHMYSLDKF